MDDHNTGAAAQAYAATQCAFTAEENGYKDGLPAEQHGLAIPEAAPITDDGRASSRIGQSHRETALATAAGTSQDGDPNKILEAAGRYLAFLDGRAAVEFVTLDPKAVYDAWAAYTNRVEG